VLVFAFASAALAAGASAALAAVVSNDPNYTASLLTSGLANPANGVLFRPLTNDVLVTEYGVSKVTKVDSTTGAKAPFVSVTKPDEMAIDSLGDVYVKQHPEGPIYRFSAAGTPLVPAAFSVPRLSCQFPAGMAFDAADNFYLACSTATEGKILKYAAGTTTSPTVFASGFGVLEGIRFNSAGKLFAADYTDSQVYEVKPGGTKLSEHTLWGNVSKPINVAFDPCGDLFATDTTTVVRIHSPGTVTTFASGFTEAFGLDFDPTGHLYVDDFATGDLWKFTPKTPCSAVVDQAITAKGTTVSATEGAGFSGTVATFEDPDTTAKTSDYTAKIKWGDGGESSGTVSGSGGKFEVSGSHTYAEEGTYTVTVTIEDADNATNTATATSTANVADAALASKCAAAETSPQAFSGPTATFIDEDPNGMSPPDYTATIEWGDSTSSPGTVSTGTGHGPYTVSGTHVYTSQGTFTITTTIKDAGGSKTVSTCRTLVFGVLPGGGSFVIGDKNATIGKVVTFSDVEWWGSNWWKENSLSGGPAPSAFKGFAESSPNPPLCGESWTTDTGNSSGPPATVPEYMAVIAASKITQSGSTISGNAPEVVIVKTNPGYLPNPGHKGTGKLMAIVCKI
jgi:hypothetical protein